MAVGGVIIVPLVGYMASYINGLKKEIDAVKEKIHKIELASVAGDELTKKHILNCKNYEPRHNIDK